MPGTRWQEIEALFDEALKRQPSERGSFVAQACGEDTELEAEVASLLASDDDAPQKFMRPSEPDGLQRRTTLDAPGIPIGSRIGRYRIKGVIASGGMGTVYLAEQEQPRRDVALKVMKAGLASRSALRRFDFEAEVLAKLHHPYIAQIYEAGMHGNEASGATGVPYFAMEYIPGAVTITEYVRSQQLSDLRRLELFTRVCDAVQYGHQQGFIHRDLKPSNILVDANGHIKLIDFGVAKATDKDQAATTLQTEVGQLIGTLQYMSPEQCASDPGGIDTRADVYALGAILFELLTGRHHHDVSNLTIHAAARIISEQAPTRPSTFKRSLRGDLDTIVLKCLEKEPSNRYQSAGHLADEIRRHMNGLPIDARPPTRWLSIYRWVVAHPIQVTIAACATMVIGTALGTWLGHWFVSQRPHRLVQLDQETVQLQSAARTFLFDWHVESPGQAILLHDRLIDRPATLGGSRLAFLCFPDSADFACADQACLFDVDRSFIDPAVVFEIEPAEPLPDPHHRGFKPEDFSVSAGGAYDIFPEVEGLELFVVHNHKERSQCFLRVYDLKGNILYQVWYDGAVAEARWLPEVRLLVLRGTNGEILWQERGVTGVLHQHPVVVFALRPRLNIKESAFLHTTPGAGPLDPVWYRQLKPDNARDLLDWWSITERDPRMGDPGRSFRIYLQVNDGLLAGVAWDVDETGNEIPESRTTSDEYKSNLMQYPVGDPKRLPDPAMFKLGDLTPISGERGASTDGP